jgi:hypothetical protein
MVCVGSGGSDTARCRPPTAGGGCCCGISAASCHCLSSSNWDSAGEDISGVSSGPASSSTTPRPQVPGPPPPSMLFVPSVNTWSGRVLAGAVAFRRSAPGDAVGLSAASGRLGDVPIELRKGEVPMEATAATSASTLVMLPEAGSGWYSVSYVPPASGRAAVGTTLRPRTKAAAAGGVPLYEAADCDDAATELPAEPESADCQDPMDPAMTLDAGCSDGTGVGMSSL